MQGGTSGKGGKETVRTTSSEQAKENRKQRQLTVAHIDELYEVQLQQLLHKLCDALGIPENERTKSDIERHAAFIKKAHDWAMQQKSDDTQIEWEHAPEHDDEEAEIERH